MKKKQIVRKKNIYLKFMPIIMNTFYNSSKFNIKREFILNFSVFKEKNHFSVIQLELKHKCKNFEHHYRHSSSKVL